MADTTPQLELPINVRFSVQTNEGGGKWVGFHIETPVSTYVLVVPPETALELARTLPKGLIDAARTAKREASQLILPEKGIHRA